MNESDNLILKFGNVIEYEGNQMVFLAQTLDFIYLAKIVYGEMAKEFIKLSAKPNADSKHTALSFVVLSTKGFQDKIAHLARTQHGLTFESFVNFICDLDQEDKARIKEEIERPFSAVPLELKELIKNITIE